MVQSDSPKHPVKEDEIIIEKANKGKQFSTVFWKKR